VPACCHLQFSAVTTVFFHVDARFVAILKSSLSHLRAAIISRNWFFTQYSANYVMTPSSGVYYPSRSSSIAILLQRPVYCFWRADFHGQGATLVTPDNLMYSLPTILPPLYRNIRATITKPQGDKYPVHLLVIPM
jgi:hypothetical protein